MPVGFSQDFPIQDFSRYHTAHTLVDTNEKIIYPNNNEYKIANIKCVNVGVSNVVFNIYLNVLSGEDNLINSNSNILCKYSLIVDEVLDIKNIIIEPNKLMVITCDQLNHLDVTVQSVMSI